MTAPDKRAYSVTEAAATTGYSVDTIRRAIRAGDLRTAHPRVDGQAMAKPVILAAELDRWLASA